MKPRRTEDAQDHRRELPPPVRVVVVLHRKQERRQAGPEAADRDENVGGHARGEEGDDELEDESPSVCGGKKETREELTFKTRPVMLEGRNRTVARTGSSRM